MTRARKRNQKQNRVVDFISSLNFFKKKKNTRNSKHHHKAKSRQKHNFKKEVTGFFKGFSFKDDSNSRGTPEHEPDKVILFVTTILVFFGAIMVYSGSFYVASSRPNTILFEYNPAHYFIFQIVWAILGTIAGVIAYKFPLDKLKWLSIIGYFIVIVLLVIVLILPGEINGAKLWIRFGPFSLQPSEFSKPILSVFLAALLAKGWKSKSSKFEDVITDYVSTRLLPFLVITLPIVILVFAGRDLATAGLIFGISLITFFLSDSNLIHNITNFIIGGIGAVLGLIFTVTEEYRMDRLARYLDFLLSGRITDPLNTGYQLRQILIAVATGGLFGYGFGQSRQKYFYLQETAFTDTIFAVIAEEFGFLGSVLVVLGFMILVFRGLKIAQNAQNKYESLIAVGISVWIFLQAFIHLAVNVGLIPLTGMTLPLMSYGGSSLIATLGGIGLLLNVSKTVKLD